MENEKEKKYFIIWLYISILLHLFVVIIMLTIKPTTAPSKDPDPASSYETQVIFIQDKPAIQPQQEEPKQLDYKIAQRIQGGDIDLQQDAAKASKEATLDKPEAALSDEYKKSTKNQTIEEDQSFDGQVNIAKDAIIDIGEQREKQILAPEQTPSQINELEQPTLSKFTTVQNSQEIKITPEQVIKTILQAKQLKSTTIKTDEAAQSLEQKVMSKKHRPADLGSENLSKVQLSKEVTEVAPKKNKMSLVDIQQGFSQFIRDGNTSSRISTKGTASAFGNSLYFSSTGNAQKDDEKGLKLASYLNQCGKMYDSACNVYSENLIKSIRKDGLPRQNNQIRITIERSGKISEILTIQSCGNTNIDNYHVKIIESMGDLPPIPKYIEAPLQVGACFTFKN